LKRHYEPKLIESRTRRPEGEVPEGSMVMEAAEKPRCLRPALLLSQEAVHRGQLPHVSGRGREGAQALPACATPVTEGMKVSRTPSDKAVKAQKGVMEFLLINHPLDCPICDQGGECQLQDLAVGYGGSSFPLRRDQARGVPQGRRPARRHAEEMSRCIHCTRCVRFGQESPASWSSAWPGAASTPRF
jgi:NADH-quinone oxidoreductase subunit G